MNVRRRELLERHVPKETVDRDDDATIILINITIYIVIIIKYIYIYIIMNHDYRLLYKGVTILCNARVESPAPANGGESNEFFKLRKRMYGHAPK